MSSPGFTVLTQDEDTVGDAVGELPLLGVQVGKRADGVGLGVVGHQIARVQVGADGVGTGGRAAEVETGMEVPSPCGAHSSTFAAATGPNTLSPGLMSAGMEGLSGSMG